MKTRKTTKSKNTSGTRRAAAARRQSIGNGRGRRTFVFPIEPSSIPEEIRKIDRLTSDECFTYWNETQRWTRKDAATVLGTTFRGFTNAAADLGHYASNRGAMLICKERGEAHGVDVYRRISDSVRERLMDFARRDAEATAKFNRAYYGR